MKIDKSTKVWWLRRLIKLTYLVVAVLLLRKLACFGQCLYYSDYPICGRVISAVAILIGGWIVITMSHKRMQSGVVKIGAFFALFLYGVCVYNIGGATLSDWWSSILLPMNNTLSIFFPSRGAYDEGLKSGFSDISLHYTLMHLLSYLYIAMLGISLFGRRAMNRSANMFVFARHRNIFWGYSDGGVLLAKDIMSKTLCYKAAFIMPENMPLSMEVERYRFEEIDGIGGIVMYRDFSKCIKRPRGRRHFFLTEDQDLNVKLAFMVLENIKKRNECWFIKSVRWMLFGRKPVTKLYVRTELAHVDRYFTKVLESLDGTAEVHTINESELTARRFIKKYPPLDMPGIANTIDAETAEVNGDFKILQLGYGWTGRAVLNKLICNTQFEGKSTFSATIFDRDLKTQHGFYPLLDEECFSSTIGDPNYYGITTECNITIGSVEFKEWVVDNIVKTPNNFNRIVVALGEDALNVKIALSIANLLNGNGMSYDYSSKLIFAHIRNADCCTYFDLDVTPISVFGNKDKIYTMGIIINDKLDMLAKELNYSYNGYKGNRDLLWHSADILSQESSRAAAVAVENTLRLQGLKMVPISDTEKSVEWHLGKDKLTKQKIDILEKLSINEHRRWNAFHFTQGIKCWNLTGVTYAVFNGGKPKPNQIKTINRHAALVSYNELKSIDKSFNDWILTYNKETLKWRPHPYAPLNLKNIFGKDGKCAITSLLMDKSDLQENDRKFIKEISELLKHINYKIVKINKTK